MIAVKDIVKIFKDEGYRIFVLAILASLFWHVFWISTIKIVSRPDNVTPVKFSKVSFLGPLLGKGAMELRARPKESSFLEIRYLKKVDLLPDYPGAAITPAIGKFEPDEGVYRSRDEGAVMLIDEALGSEKMEPSYDEE